MVKDLDVIVAPLSLGSPSSVVSAAGAVGVGVGVGVEKLKSVRPDFLSFATRPASVSFISGH